MSDEICKYCTSFQASENYCRKHKTTKWSKSTCDDFKKSKFADITRKSQGGYRWYK